MLTYIDDDLSIDLSCIFYFERIKHGAVDVYMIHSIVNNLSREITKSQYEIICPKIKKTQTQEISTSTHVITESNYHNALGGIPVNAPPNDLSKENDLLNKYFESNLDYLRNMAALCKKAESI